MNPTKYSPEKILAKKTSFQIDDLVNNQLRKDDNRFVGVSVVYSNDADFLPRDYTQRFYLCVCWEEEIPEYIKLPKKLNDIFIYNKKVGKTEFAQQR